MAERDNYDAFGKCALNLQVEGEDSGIPPSSLNLTIFDSIHNLYPTAKLNFSDYTGIYHEYMGFVDGIKLSLSFGLSTKDWKTCPYVVFKNSEPAQFAQNGLGGNLELSLIHDYYSVQNKESAGYNSNISDIISDLIKKYQFEGTDIDSTLNSGLWYQPYVTDADFIRNILMPYAYSTDAQFSPFYAFITSDNQFFFKSYKKMIMQNPVKEYTYRTLGSADALSEDSILTAVPVQMSMSEIKPFYNRIKYYWNEVGEYVKESENALITDYPKGVTEPIPVKADIDLVTGLIHQLDDDIMLEDTKNDRFGQEINPVSKAVSPEKMIVSVMLNRELSSGKVVKLNFPTVKENNSSEKSLRSSGNYLIESCYHKWTGRDAITVMVCVKQTVTTSSYRNNNIILSR